MNFDLTIVQLSPSLFEFPALEDLCPYNKRLPFVIFLYRYARALFAAVRKFSEHKSLLIEN